MEKFSKYVCVKESDSERCELIYVDFKYDGTEINSISPPYVFTKVCVLTQTNKRKVKKLLVGRIIKLSSIHYDSLDESVKTRLTVNDVDSRKLYSKVAACNALIAVDSRIGPCTNMLVSKENYKKYDLKTVCESFRYNVMFDDSVEDIYLYRRNSVDQPGLLLVYCDSKYDFIESGYFPEKSFIKIKL